MTALRSYVIHDQLWTSIMEGTSKSSSVLLSKFFHALHLCVSVGLVIAMVHNQLTNDARINNLENKINLQCHSKKNVEGNPPMESAIKGRHFIVKRNVRAPTKLHKKMNLKNGTSSLQQQEVGKDKEKDVLTCLDTLRFFVKNETSVRKRIAQMNVCEQFRGPPGKQGVRGLRGKKGKPGTRGLPGQKGRTGYKGSMGKHGPPGPRGEKGFSGNVTVIGLKGDMGPKGDKGDKGGQGMEGQQGIKGHKGDSGGPKGDRGEPGEKGESGPRGCPGDRFVAPQFYSSPQSLIFAERESAILFCNAIANPYSHITWYRDNVKIANGSRYAVKEIVTVPKDLRSNKIPCSKNKHPRTQSSLVIKRSQASDTGNYFCEARNSVMGVFRHSITLLILHDQDPCFTYTNISDTTRNVNNGYSGKCDDKIAVQWYRLTGAAGVRMPTSCVPMQHCGTIAPGWLSDPHPNVGQGIISRKVCYTLYSVCCISPNKIRVRNCGAFYVYEFKPPPHCSLRYCGTN